MKRVKRFFPLLILTPIFLSSCGDPFKPEDFTSRIFFNVWDFLAVFLAFVVLITVAFFFAYKPIKKFIKNRGDYVEGKINEANVREEKSRNLIIEGEQIVKESKKEATAIIEKANIDANKQKDEIIAKAKSDANREKEKAREEIALEIENKKLSFVSEPTEDKNNFTHFHTPFQLLILQSLQLHLNMDTLLNQLHPHCSILTLISYNIEVLPFHT